MPVSRKRKKNRTSPVSKRRPSTGASIASQPAWPGGPSVQDAAQILARMSEDRDRLAEHRAATATANAEHVVADLIAYTLVNPDLDAEAELCALLGAHLRRWKDLPLNEAPDSDALIEAVVIAAAASVRQALAADPPVNGRSAWQALVTVAGVVPTSSTPVVDQAVAELRRLAGGRAVPALPAGPAVAGPVQWVRDGYGSRFGIVAPIVSPGKSPRWYLWDVDACAYNPMTVYAGYHDSPEQALADWQAAVGPVAADAAVLTDVDDPTLLAELLDREYAYRAGPESMLTEHVRSRRLADVVIESLPPRSAATVDVLDTETAVAAFIAWLTDRHPELAATDGLAELARELIDSWLFGEPRALLATCSPHRVAHSVLHIHNYYRGDFASELMTLMPAWTQWLAEHNGTPPELAARCHPYALGQPHADVGADNSRPIMTARVIE